MGKAGKNKKSLMFEKILRHRVKETYGTSVPSIDKLIDGLRAKYPEYCRYRHQLFTRMVKQTLDVHNNNDKKRKLSANYEEDDDVMSQPSASKKAKKIEIRGRGTELQTEPSELESSSTHTVLSFENESQQFEPGFDFTKSMLRNKYSGSTIPKNKELELDLTKSMLRNKYKPKSVELELVTDRKVDFVIEDKTVKQDLVQKASSLSNDDNGVGTVGKDDGPLFKDLGGIDDVLDELNLKVIVPVYLPHVPRQIGVRPTTGILLHGPPGCGKTTLAHAIANETRLPFYKISAPELVSGVLGASEENLREWFAKAYRTAPSILFIDEIDAIASTRENLQRETERRMVTQLMICMDNTSKNKDGKRGHVLVIGATNRPDALDPALRRPGRFDREITLGVPDENARIKILSLLTQDIKLEGAFDLVKISRLTPGFVGADLEALVKEAGELAMKRFFHGRKLEQNEDRWRKDTTPEEMDNLSITMFDFEAAAKLVQPSSKREGFTSIPNVKWEDIGGLEMLRREFNEYLVKRIKNPNKDKANGLRLETGFLLYGPPGCGKTLIAKAVANEAGANFIHIQGPELKSKYVGESESKARIMFSRARTCAPCILFFDEVDALTTKRGTEGAWVVGGLLNQLLEELDGGDQRKGVYIIGATNRPEIMDQALLRPGRFGKLLYVPLPNQDERVLILKALSKNWRLNANVDLIAIARRCANFSGADLSKLMNEAARVASEENFSEIKHAHIEQELGKLRPTVSDKEKRHYDRLAKRFGAY
ncbi:putative AAA+ ATPase domain, ATPase, AAA-type, core, AAA ATPase, AAA+ lid domain-containing protein [Helianthus annuus]|nr:putative AAA+ ATPase domain, ATPase, AAA-type, core, AAA ATPase, AAA+ lid domain-containing protein [Helianthus annuus]KAJ0868742.1 putative AAA+ ATPase domain, ATPase, AAA-type, core, AAA ATPase, AAA+ lid domain-containing protein [Helianthus annuus]